jgi:anti-sigma B factor antagonist
MTEQAAPCILSLEVERKGDVAVVHCHGRLISEVSGGFYTRISKLIPEHKQIVLDLCDLSHMDSMGLGSLARLYVSAKSKGCQLQLIYWGSRIFSGCSARCANTGLRWGSESAARTCMPRARSR